MTAYFMPFEIYRYIYQPDLCITDALDIPMNTDNHLNAGENKAVYTLGVTSKLSGLPAHSIRQYIDKGLLIPYKLDSMRHLFSMNDVYRLKHIHHLLHEKGLNFAGIRALFSMVPCWVIVKCPESERENCEGYRTDLSPCWEASNKGVACKNRDCRECSAYTCFSQSAYLRSVIKEMI